MPTTPNRAYPYPAPADPVDIPGDMQELAEAIDDDLEAIAATAGPRPLASIANFESQNAPASTSTTLQFTQVDYDNGPYTNLGTIPDAIMLPNTGIWQVWGLVQIGDISNTTTDLLIDVQIHAVDPSSGGSTFIMAETSQALDTGANAPTTATLELSNTYNMALHPTPRNVKLVIDTNNVEQFSGVLPVLSCKLGACLIDE